MIGGKIRKKMKNGNLRSIGEHGKGENGYENLPEKFHFPPPNRTTKKKNQRFQRLMSSV